MILAILALAAALQDGDPVRAPGPASSVPPRPAARQEPQEPPPSPLDPPAPAPPKPRKPREVRVRTGLEVEYNSNITRLSEAQIDELESGARPDKYRIEDADDVITSPWAEVSLDLDLFAEPSRAGVKVQGNFFAQNSFASYGEAGVFFRHAGFELEYGYGHELYRREYRNLDTDEFESAFYDEHQAEASYRFRPHEIVRLKPLLALRLRDYEAPFDHRDALEVYFAGEGLVEATPWLRLSLELGYAIQDAYAESGQPDTSYNEAAVEAKATVLPHKAVELSISYRLEDREYTTDNDPAVDPGHRDRTDDRRIACLEGVWKISKSVHLDASLTFTRVQSDTPADPGASSEETDWDRDEYVLGVQVLF